MAQLAPINSIASQNGTGLTRTVALQSLAEMTVWAAAWQELDATSTASHRFFQSYGWCKEWMLRHGGTRFSPFVLLLLDGETLLAVLPLMRETTRTGVKILRSLGEPHTQYGNVLTRDGTLSGTEISALHDELVRRSNADSIIINYVPEGSPLAGILGNGTRARELDNEAAQFDLRAFNSPADYRASLSKNRRRARRKAETALAEFGEVAMDVLRPSDAGYAHAIGHCIDLKKKWLKHTGRIGTGLDYDGHGTFLASLPYSAARDGVIVFVLKAGPVAVAYEVGFLQSGHYYSYLGSFMWSLRHASPGNLQIEMTLEWLMANGVQTFDLLGNPVHYKDQWSNRLVPLTGHVLNLSIVGQIYSAVWARRMRPYMKSLYLRMPIKVRSAFAMLRRVDLSKLKSA